MTTTNTEVNTNTFFDVDEAYERSIEELHDAIFGVCPEVPPPTPYDISLCANEPCPYGCGLCACSGCAEQGPCCEFSEIEQLGMVTQAIASMVLLKGDAR